MLHSLFVFPSPLAIGGPFFPTLVNPAKAIWLEVDMHRPTQEHGAVPLCPLFQVKGYFNLACGLAMTVNCMYHLHLLMFRSYYQLRVVSVYVCEDTYRWPEHWDAWLSKLDYFLWRSGSFSQLTSALNWTGNGGRKIQFLPRGIWALFAFCCHTDMPLVHSPLDSDSTTFCESLT